jgi:hypothetical protein
MVHDHATPWLLCVRENDALPKGTSMKSQELTHGMALG